MPKDDRTELAWKLGRTFRRHRLLQDRTQLAVADAIGVSQPTYSQWERGRSMPAFDDLVRLLSELDIDATVLLGLVEDDDATNGDEGEAA